MGQSLPESVEQKLAGKPEKQSAGSHQAAAKHTNSHFL